MARWSEWNWRWLNGVLRKMDFVLYYFVSKKELGLCMSVSECRKLKGGEEGCIVR